MYKKHYFLLLAIILATIISVVIFYKFNNENSFNIKITKPQMIWGVVLRPYALASTMGGSTDWKYNVDRQIAMTKELGANAVKFALELDDQVNDYIVKKAAENDLKVLISVSIPGINLITSGSQNDYYDEGYKLGEKVAKKYQGRIKYYQMDNEISGTLYNKADDVGETLPDRFGQRYNRTRTERQIRYLKGMSNAIHKNDPKAIRSISGHWILVDAIKYMINNGVEFEFLGWDWYSDMGEDFSNRSLEGKDNFNLVKIANEEFKKDLWIVEANKDKGSWENTEREQAEFIESIAQKSWEKGVKGFFIHTLVDMASEQNESIGHLGLVKVKKDPNTNQWDFGDYKSAFYRYKAVIEKYPKVK